MLAGMQKSINDLESRITELEKLKPISKITPTVSQPTPSLTVSSQRTSSKPQQPKRVRIAASSSDETGPAGPKAVDLESQAYMDQQNQIIADQQRQLKDAMTQIADLASRIPQ